MEVATRKLMIELVATMTEEEARVLKVFFSNSEHDVLSLEEAKLAQSVALRLAAALPN
jgi:hypothetical protein